MSTEPDETYIFTKPQAAKTPGFGNVPKLDFVPQCE